VEDFFLFIGNLPIHPIAVHFAVVLFPLAALAVALIAALPRLRIRYLGASVVALTLTVPLVYIAQQSGKALGDFYYEPDPHATYGDMMTPIALGTAGLALLFWLAIRNKWPKFLSRALGFLVVSAAIGASAMTFVVGHSGADATWGNKFPSASSDSTITNTTAMPEESTRKTGAS
jgi:hypothetical protein